MDKSCIFCRIASGEVPSERVHETPSWIAVQDTDPQAPVHLVVFPRDHEPRTTFRKHGELRFAWAADTIVKIAASAAEAVGLEDYRLVINNGPGAGQEVPHLHAHVLGGWTGIVPGIGGGRG